MQQLWSMVAGYFISSGRLWSTEMVHLICSSIVEHSFLISSRTAGIVKYSTLIKMSGKIFVIFREGIGCKVNFDYKFP
jgi:hypothetical protein